MLLHNIPASILMAKKERKKKEMNILLLYCIILQLS